MKVGFLGHAIPTDSWGNWNFITRRDTVKNKFSLGKLALLSLFLVLAPAAVAEHDLVRQRHEWQRQERLQDASDCLQDNRSCHLAGLHW